MLLEGTVEYYLQFTEVDQADIPEKSGVYVFEDNAGTTLYVGITCNFKRRVQEHRKGRTALKNHFQYVDKIKFCACNNLDTLALLEQFTITRLKPILNKPFYSRTINNRYLDKQTVQDILYYLQEGYSQRFLSDVFNIARSTIGDIHRKRTYTDIYIDQEYKPKTIII